MDIKGLIETFSATQNDLQNRINNLKLSFEKEEALWEDLEKVDIDFYLNANAFNFLGDCLQMVNSDQRLQTFELKDIKRLYELLIKYYPDNIQYQTDLITFVYNVLGDEDEAVKLINKVVPLIDARRAYFKKILVEIEKGR